MTVVFVSVFQDEALVVKSLLESAGLSPALLEEGFLDVGGLAIKTKCVDAAIGDDRGAGAADFVGPAVMGAADFELVGQLDRGRGDAVLRGTAPVEPAGGRGE